MIARHFSLEDLIKSDVALRLAIANDPGPREIENLERLCQFILDPVAEEFGRNRMMITSCYRSPILNQMIGGKAGSQHLFGEAVDFEVQGKSNGALANWIKGNLNFDQLILEHHDPKVPHSGWVHCSYREGRLRKEFLNVR